MPNEQTVLGERLQEARISCGLTQQDVASKLGISKTAIVNIEAGDRSVSTVELTTLALLYRCSASELLSDTMPDEDDLFVVLHRLDEDFASDTKVQKEVSDHVAICREGHELKGLLGIPLEDGPPNYNFGVPHSTFEAVEHGSIAATQERKRRGLDSNPLPDLANLISAQGIWAAKADLPDEMSGMFLHHATFGSVILINEGHPLSRRRFSFAHEYAHALFDRSHPSISSRKNRKDYREVRANAFAAAFLLPEEGVRSFLQHRRKTLPSRVDQIVYDPLAPGMQDLTSARTRNMASHTKVTYQDVASLMIFFRTSYQATCYRLKSLNLLGKDELEELLDKEVFAKTAFEVLGLLEGDPRPERNDSQLDQDVLRLQVVNLAVEAFRRNLVSEGKLCDISSVLGIRAADLLKLAEVA